MAYRNDTIRDLSTEMRLSAVIFPSSIHRHHSSQLHTAVTPVSMVDTALLGEIALPFGSMDRERH